MVADEGGVGGELDAEVREIGLDFERGTFAARLAMSMRNMGTNLSSNSSSSQPAGEVSQKKQRG